MAIYIGLIRGMDGGPDDVFFSVGTNAKSFDLCLGDREGGCLGYREVGVDAEWMRQDYAFLERAVSGSIANDGNIDDVIADIVSEGLTLYKEIILKNAPK